MGDLEGRVAVITGAARGIGRATAIALARQGADVVAIDIAAPIPGNAQSTGTEEELGETASLVEGEGRRCRTVKADARDSEAMDRVMRETAEGFGQLDILVSNVGIAVHAPFAELTDEQWDLQLGVNLMGVVRPMRAAAPHMRAQSYGRMIALSSVGGRAGTPGVAAYAASKWGMIGVVKTAALELGGDGITVNAVCPTAVNTPLFRSDEQYRDMVPDLYDQDLPFEKREERVKEIMSTSVHALSVPWVEPEDVANTIEFLVSEKARYITGEIVDVAAGSNARWMG